MEMKFHGNLFPYELMLLVRGFRPAQIDQKRKHATKGSDEVSRREIEPVRDETRRKHPDTRAHVERGQVGRGGRPPELVRRDIDKQALISWNAGAKSDAQV